MGSDDTSLLRWTHRKGDGLFKVTLGQLVTLLELCSNESVAAMGGKSESQAVNYRQKLLRLQQALGVGPLTYLDKKGTRPNPAGVRIAGEVRMLLQEIRAAEAGPKNEAQTWLVGAGDAWLQSTIVPALANVGVQRPQWRWEVHNLKAHDICRRLRQGELHFGFVRKVDAEKFAGIELSTPFDVSAFCIVAGSAASAPTEALALLRWLIRENRPLVQQGSTWLPTRAAVEKSLKQVDLLSDILPVVICETHTQAAVAAMQSNSWCIVPATLSRLYLGKNVRITKVTGKQELNEMAVAYYPRVLGKFPDGLTARDELRRTIGRMLAAAA